MFCACDKQLQILVHLFFTFYEINKCKGYLLFSNFLKCLLNVIIVRSFTTTTKIFP